MDILRLGTRGPGRIFPSHHRLRLRYTRQIQRHSTAATQGTDTSSGNQTLPPTQLITKTSLGQQSFESRLDRIRSAPSFSSFLTDSFDRQHNYLRISVTERCNLRCTYCMPEEGVPLSPPTHNLTTPEILLLSELFISQGVNKIRLTGGEPTVRRDFLDLFQKIGQFRNRGLKELCITTNGVSLHRKLDAMAEAGLSGVNLSLDTLDPFLFQIMTRRKGFDAVMKTLNRILELKNLGASIKLKLNCVVMRGVNDHEILPFVELGREKDLEVRFIEYMPFDGNKWERKKMFSYEEMLDVIRGRFPDFQRLTDKKGETSKTWQIPGFVGKVGFITSMTENFCGTCNRLRITSDGNLKVCLFGNAEVSLRDLLREMSSQQPIDETTYQAMIAAKSIEKSIADGASPVLRDPELEARLLEVIGKAVGRKKARHAGMGELEKMPNRPMILIDDLQQLFQQAITRPRPSVPTYRLGRASATRLQAAMRSLSQAYGGGSSARCFSTSTKWYQKASRGSASKIPSAADENEQPTALPHLTSQSTAHMVSVSSKPVTRRTATVIGSVRFSNAKVLDAIRLHLNRKGDVLGTARIAGIMGAKRCSDIIPLCHPGLGIEHVNVEVEAVDASAQPVSGSQKTQPYTTQALGDHGGVRIQATVVCEGKTGIEMEAFTAVMAAAVSVVDMCKALDKKLVIEDVRLVRKEGGRSGVFADPDFNS